MRKSASHFKREHEGPDAKINSWWMKDLSVQIKYRWFFFLYILEVEEPFKA